MSESTILTAETYRNMEQQEVEDSPDKVKTGKDENLEVNDDEVVANDANTEKSEAKEMETSTDAQDDSEKTDSHDDANDEQTQDDLDDEGKKPEKSEHPRWYDKRLEREFKKHKRNLSRIEEEARQRLLSQPQHMQQYDQSTQIQNPFTGAIVEINSAEGQAIIQLANAAQAQEQLEKQKKINEAQAELKRKLEKGYDKFDDYEEMISDAGITPTMLEAAYLSDKPDELLYNLSKYKSGEIERISKLSPERQFREMVILEQQMQQSTKKKIVKKVPEPPSKIKGSGSSMQDESDLSFEDTLRRRKEAQRKALGLR